MKYIYILIIIEEPYEAKSFMYGFEIEILTVMIISTIIIEQFKYS